MLRRAGMIHRHPRARLFPCLLRNRRDFGKPVSQRHEIKPRPTYHDRRAIRLSQPVDFQAIDGLPVDLVFLLLSPPDAGAEHLKALATVSRLFRDRQAVAKLRGARSKDALFALLAGVDARDAA